MKHVILTLLVSLIGFTVMAQKAEVIQIKTSAVCFMCKETIESKMIFEKGIIKAELDVESAILTVKYKPKKTSPEKIQKQVSMIGYDADEVEADPVAYEALHFCCKKDSHKEE